MNYENKIKALGLILPPPPKPVGSYHPVVTNGGLAFLSGQISRTSQGAIVTGKVGTDLTLEQGKEAARIAALNVLSIIQHLVGFDKFERILHVVGYVQTAADFYEIPQVMNAASDLLIEVFGDRGIHSRSAVGMASLPLNAAVEIEATLQIRSQMKSP
jgi:enamine deaminase RidA (YjgF/YER057c/UK114 family)